MWQFKDGDRTLEPYWSEEAAAEKVNALCMIGITEMRGEEVIARHQMFGTIRNVTRDGVLFDLLGSRKGQTWMGPADDQAFVPAQEGIYRLRDTGEEVEDPDYEFSWIIDLGPASAN
jgi:hypothetical protein